MAAEAPHEESEDSADTAEICSFLCHCDLRFGISCFPTFSVLHRISYGEFSPALSPTFQAWPEKRKKKFLEISAALDSSTLGQRIWPVSSLFLRYFPSRLSLFAGHRVLELGCGVGIGGLGLSAALRQAGLSSEIVLSDQSSMMSLVESSISLNSDLSSSSSISCFPLDWTAPGDSLALRAIFPQGFQCFLLSDCCYSHENIDPLLKTVDILRSSESPCWIFLGVEERPAIREVGDNLQSLKPIQRFLRGAEERKFKLIASECEHAEQLLAASADPQQPHHQRSLRLLVLSG